MGLHVSPYGDKLIYMEKETTENIIKAVNQQILVEILRGGESKHGVAVKAGIPSTTFNRKIAGNGDFTLRELGDIANVFGLTIQDLLTVNLVKEKTG